VVTLDSAALERFARAREADFVVLFGSSARGESSPGDVDLGVWTERPATSLELARDLTRELGRGDLDVVALAPAGWLLWQEVARDGIALYEARPGRFRAFQLEATLRGWDADVWRRRTRLTTFPPGKPTLMLPGPCRSGGSTSAV